MRTSRCMQLSFLIYIILLWGPVPASDLVAQAVSHELQPAPQVSPMPSVRQPGNGLEWISADFVTENLSSRGEESLLPERVRQDLQRLIAVANDTCHVGRDVIRPTAGSGGQDLPTALRNAEYALFATVTGVDQGFARTIPGTLYRVRVEEALVGPKTIGQEYFFFLPVGDFRVAGQRICVEVPSYPAHLPEVDDQVLLLMGEVPAFDWLPIIGRTGLVVLRGDEVFLPQPYQVSESTTWNGKAEGFRHWVRGLVEGGT